MSFSCSVWKDEAGELSKSREVLHKCEPTESKITKAHNRFESKRPWLQQT